MNCNSPGAEKPTGLRLRYKKQDNFFIQFPSLPHPHTVSITTRAERGRRKEKKKKQ